MLADKTEIKNTDNYRGIRFLILKFRKDSEV